MDNRASASRNLATSLGSRGWRLVARVGDVIQNADIDFMADADPDRQTTICHGSSNPIVVEPCQVNRRAAATDDTNQIQRLRLQPLDGSNDGACCSCPLHLRRDMQDSEGESRHRQRRQEVRIGRRIGGGHEPDREGNAGDNELPISFKQAVSLQALKNEPALPVDLGLPEAQIDIEHDE